MRLNRTVGCIAMVPSLPFRFVRGRTIGPATDSALGGRGPPASIKGS